MSVLGIFPQIFIRWTTHTKSKSQHTSYNWNNTEYVLTITDLNLKSVNKKVSKKPPKVWKWNNPYIKEELLIENVLCLSIMKREYITFVLWDWIHLQKKKKNKNKETSKYICEEKAWK